MEAIKYPQGAAVQTAALDLSELRRQMISHIALALSLLAAAVGLFTLPGFGFDPGLFWTFFTLFAAGFAAYRLCESRPRLALATLAVGLVAGYGLGLFLLPYDGVQYLGGLIVLLLTALYVWLGAASGAVISLMIAYWAGWASAAALPLASVWIAFGCQWISSRALYMALDWAWSNQVRANDLLRALREQQGKQARTLTALTEATRRLQRTGYQLHIARMRAEELSEVKINFAANISHELRTPLTLILGFSETMYFSPEIYGDMQWPTALRRDVNHIYQASRQLLDLLNDVLDLSRIDMVHMPITREWSSLDDVIHEALDTVRHLVKSDWVSVCGHTG